MDPVQIGLVLLVFAFWGSGFVLGRYWERHVSPVPNIPHADPSPRHAPSLDAFAVIERLNGDGEVIAVKEANTAVKMAAIVESERSCGQHGRVILDGEIIATWEN